jgi:hypothetical protein
MYSQGIRAVFPAGTQLQFDALVELKTEEPSTRHSFGYVSGLNIRGRKGRAETFSALADHEPNFGTHPEQRVVSLIDVEQETDFIGAGFIHQAGGSFSVRDPRLIDISRFPGCRVP